MSYEFNALTRIGTFGGKGVFGYATNDLKATVKAADYFLDAEDLLDVGDLIHVSGDLDGTPYYALLMVNANTGSTVTVIEAANSGMPVPVRLPDLSSKASDAAVVRFVAPFAGTLQKIYTVLNAALATGDATFTAAIGGVGVTNGVVTATQSGSAAGDVDSATPTAANTFAAGDLITITGGGASTATATAGVTLLLQPT